MKFSLKQTSGPGRLGILSNVSRLQDFEMETPHAFLYTKGGTVPHMVHEVLQKVTTQNLGLNIPIPSISYLQDRLKLSKFDIAEFIGMKEYLSYCTFINPGEKRVSGFHEKGKIPMWSKRGRQMFTAKSYMELIEDLKPDLFLALADGDTDSNSSKKRVTKAFDNSVSVFKECMEIYKQSEISKKSHVIGALEGGYDVTVREKCSKIVGESPVFGVVIDGLHDCSETVCAISLHDIKEAVEASLKHIPNDKLRIIHGCWNPSVLLDLVQLGIDMFDSSYPYFITEQAGALTFPNTESILENYELNDVKAALVADTKKNDFTNEKPEVEKIEGPPKKRIKLVTKSKYHISLMDSVHVTDFTPILKNCDCYTCKNHTRAYVHHLMSVEELLGSTLLMMHNLHHYLLFLSSIRQAINCGKFEELKKNFQAWVNKMNNISSS